MELVDFLRETQSEVRELVNERMITPGESYPEPEMVFAEVMMRHMQEVGMTFEPQLCRYEGTIGNGKLRLSGFALSDECDQVDLFVSLYSGVDDIENLSTAEPAKAAEQCIRFLSRCVEKKLADQMDETHEAYVFALTLQKAYQGLDQIRIYVLTDKVVKHKQFKDRIIQGKTIKLEVMDIERLYRHTSAGKPRDELVFNFEDVTGTALPCVWVPSEMSEYDYAMTVIPGEALRFIYEKYGPRILEANVRSFLSVTGKVNKGIRDTLCNEPERFMAYNNGLVIVADEVHLGKTADGGPGITWIKGLQVVNGGQTSASLYFTKKKYGASVDLSRVRVPAKVIVLHSSDAVSEETLIADISRYANSQNAVKQSDFAANHPLHVELENHATRTYCPDGTSRWFYERASGSYKVMLEREGNTPAKQRALKNSIPPARKITKPDMAKYLNIWQKKPHVVSLGAQKNFIKFMESQSSFRWESGEELPTLQDYKYLVAKTIIFLATQKIIRRRYKAFQANITVYTLSALVQKLGSHLNLEMVWQNQAISPALSEQIGLWSQKIHDELHRSAMTRMVSEWAKKPECWEHMRSVRLDEPMINIPEIN